MLQSETCMFSTKYFQNLYCPLDRFRVWIIMHCNPKNNFDANVTIKGIQCSIFVVMPSKAENSPDLFECSIPLIVTFASNLFFGLQCTMIRTLKRSRFFPISMRSLGIRIDVIGFFIQSGGLYKGHPALLLPSSKRPRRPCIVHNCCIYILSNINSNILSLFSGVTHDNCTHIQAGPKDGQKAFSCHTFFFLLGNPHQLHLSHAL